jgi:hypothetical protein
MALSLKNKIVITSCATVILLMVNCGGKEVAKTEKQAVDSAACEKAPVNPNGDSELALLMREMLHNSESLKEMIKSGNLPDKFPEAFLKIHTAKATETDMKKESFNGFADNYLANLQTLYKSPKEKLTSNYNAVINACISCHTEHCPGPLRAINKLKISE